MSTKIITSTLHNVSPVPNGSIYQGGGMFEFVAEIGKVWKEIPVINASGGVVLEMREVKMEEPYNIAKKYAEYDVEKGTYYKDPSVKIPLAADALVAEKEKTGKVARVDATGKPVKPGKP